MAPAASGLAHARLLLPPCGAVCMHADTPRPPPALLSSLSSLAHAAHNTQGKQVLSDGIGRAPEEEHEVDPVAARAFLTDPALLLNLGTPLLEKVKRWVGGCGGGHVLDGR